MKAICLCHEVVCERKELLGPIKYQGPSPDEIALVEAASDVGFVLQNASEDTIELNFTNGVMQCDSYYSDEENKPVVQAENVELEFEFERNRHGVHYGPGVHLFEVKRRMQFTSERKRMSVLVKDPMDGHYKLFIKGADSTIEERLDPDAND
jgi:magnesium-transporting ATPase (P-type)